MTRRKHTGPAWLIAAFSWIIWLSIVLFLPPGSLLVEIGMLVALFLALFLTTALVSKRKKTSLLFTLLVLGILVLRRLANFN